MPRLLRAVNPSSSPFRLTAAAMLFTLQIYCDFSGYCNMARGLAAMLGIRLTANFRYPLFSRNQTDFWHRWNISLTTWFRDYVYIPLGGSRHGQFRTCCNILIVFVLSGLWHGAAFNYVTWGMVCGVLIILTRLAGQTGLRPGNEPSDKPGDLLRIASNLYLIIITFVIFRLNDTERSIIVIEQIWWPLLLIISTLLGGGYFMPPTSSERIHTAWRYSAAGGGGYMDRIFTRSGSGTRCDRNFTCIDNRDAGY